MKKKMIILFLVLGVGLLLILSLFRKTPEKIEKTTENRVIVIMKQIQKAAKAIFEEYGNYSKVDCSYPEISSICRELKLWLGKEPIIHSSSAAYCSYTRLRLGEYYCIDSAGTAGYTLINPADPRYCTSDTFNCPPAK